MTFSVHMNLGNCKMIFFCNTLKIIETYIPRKVLPSPVGLTQLKDLAYTVVPPQHEKKRDDDSFKDFFCFSVWGSFPCYLLYILGLKSLICVLFAAF